MTGWRKFTLCILAMGLVALLGLVGGDLPPESVGHLASAIGWIAAAFTGGNGLEHIARSVSGRARPPE